MNANSKVHQDHLHANNLSKRNQRRKDQELGKTKQTWEKNIPTKKNIFLYNILNANMFWNTMREPKYKRLKESSRTN